MSVHRQGAHRRPAACLALPTRHRRLPRRSTRPIRTRLGSSSPRSSWRSRSRRPGPGCRAEPGPGPTAGAVRARVCTGSCDSGTYSGSRHRRGRSPCRTARRRSPGTIPRGLARRRPIRSNVAGVASGCAAVTAAGDGATASTCSTDHLTSSNVSPTLGLWSIWCDPSIGIHVSADAPQSRKG